MSKGEFIYKFFKKEVAAILSPLEVIILEVGMTAEHLKNGQYQTVPMDWYVEALETWENRKHN